ncbi:MAG: autotransporter outer membrane beta-barrel domain-containing protein [Deltaproteobacteria bacterium]|nr:autotransporter outer membrane beta-barrel domain-containing protein [Deltaproteobacteria bacterium]
MEYDFALVQAGNKLTARVTSVGLSEESKSISEGLVGSMGTIIFASDHASSRTISDAMEAAATVGISGGIPIGTFGSASGGSMRYESGSHVDVESFHVSLGASYAAKLDPGRLTVGIFGEYGIGSYDTVNSFPNAGVVLGHGDTRYLGIGVLARFDFSQTAMGNFYAELTARLGTVENEYWSDDILRGQRVSYSSRAPYYGFHLGVGHKWKLGQSGVLDTYVKYLWNHQNADKVVVSTGETVSFRAVDSHRLRVGARYNHFVSGRVSPYVGIAYEHEFDGRADAFVNGLAVESPSMRGGTGMGELGISFTTGEGSRLSVDLGVQAYVGKRQGFSGSLTLRLEFE